QSSFCLLESLTLEEALGICKRALGSVPCQNGAVNFDATSGFELWQPRALRWRRISPRFRPDYWIIARFRHGRALSRRRSPIFFLAALAPFICLGPARKAKPGFHKQRPATLLSQTPLFLSTRARWGSYLKRQRRWFSPPRN